MSFVDKVKNPLDNDEFLKSMILLYARQSNEDRKSGSYIYDELIKHPESEADADKNIHTWNFKKFVEQDTVCKLLTDVLRYSQEEAIRIYMNLFLEGKDESEIDSINIDKGELVSKLEDADILDIHYDDKYMEMPIKDILREAFTAKGTMGYHVYKSKFGDKWATSDATMKFYINAGENTYEFSKLFKQKCEEHNMIYMYKVVNPERDEEKRADRMCIYMGLNDVEEYLGIIKQIRFEHPTFDYKAPSPLMGDLDGWIGVGADPDNFALANSYNDSRAILIENSLSKVLGNATEKKIKRMLENNPDTLISKLRAEIERRAAEYMITKNFALDDVIFESLNIQPKDRVNYYTINRNALFSRLPSNESEKSVFEKIKAFFRFAKSKKREKKSQDTEVRAMPDRQLTYGEDYNNDEVVYHKGLKVNPDEQLEIPLVQQPIIKHSRSADNENR